MISQTPSISGSLCVPAHKLRRMVELSPAWQDAIRETDRPPDAPNRVWLRDVIGTVARPFAVVSVGAVHQLLLQFGGGRNYLRPNGQLFLFMTVDTSPLFYEDRVAAEFEAASLFGRVVDDVAELSAADDTESEDMTSHLAITSIELQQFGEVPEENWQSLGRWFFCGYTVNWGDGTGGG